MAVLALAGDQRDAQHGDLAVVHPLDFGNGDLVLAVQPILERPDHPPLVLERLGPGDAELELQHSDDHVWSPCVFSRVTKVIPDEKTQGDVDITFKTRFYPNADETTHGPYTPANPTSVRFSGRQLRMRVEGARLADWRVGNMRIDATAGGRR